jgi:hypothetical protein
VGINTKQSLPSTTVRTMVSCAPRNSSKPKTDLRVSLTRGHYAIAADARFDSAANDASHKLTTMGVNSRYKMKKRMDKLQKRNISKNPQIADIIGR